MYVRFHFVEGSTYMARRDGSVWPDSDAIIAER